MWVIGKASRRPPAVRPRDRNGGFPRLSDGVAHGLRCLASPHHALLAESLGKPSPWVINKDLWYYERMSQSGGAAGSKGPPRRAVTPGFADQAADAGQRIGDDLEHLEARGLDRPG